MTRAPGGSGFDRRVPAAWGAGDSTFAVSRGRGVAGSVMGRRPSWRHSLSQRGLLGALRRARGAATLPTRFCPAVAIGTGSGIVASGGSFREPLPRPDTGQMPRRSRERVPPKFPDIRLLTPHSHSLRRIEVDSPLIAPDLALDRLHLIVPDGSDAMVVLTTLANGGAAGVDPRALFAERMSELGHLTVSFTDEDPPQVRLALPDLTLQCVPQPDPGGDPAHLALRVISLKPVSDHPEGAKILTLTARHPVVTAANGVASDTFRLLDWRRAGAKAAKSERLYATLKLVERLEGAEKGRAQTQRTRYVATREFWRCKTCRALWRPGGDTQCTSCGREFGEMDRRQPEIAKVEFSVPEGETINLAPDAAVLVEPEDEPNFVGRVSRIDHRRHTVQGWTL